MDAKNIYQTIGFRNKANALLTRCCFVFALPLLFTLGGCKKFLDAPTVNKVPQATLFSTEQGFIDALTGVYLGMDRPNYGGNRGLYTDDLSMGMLSVMGYSYTNALTITSAEDGLFTSAANYSYTDAVIKNEIEGIWGGLYNNISDLNTLLEKIDNQKAIFTRDNYYRVKGESLALRALFHFDLARMFGQPPLTSANARAIPYVTKYGVKSVPFSTLKAAIDSCITDLKTAKSLLAQTDTAALTPGSLNLFAAYTQNHINYWATQALLARAYLYKGDTINAMANAKAVIASGKFPLIKSNVASAANPVRDRLFSQELVFSLYSRNVTGIVSTVPYSGNSTIAPVVAAANKTAIYTATTGSTADYRYISWFDNNSSNVSVPSKYFQDANLPYQLQNNIPLLRISEMYYIVAECAGRSGDVATGLSYLNQVRAGRGLSALTATTINSPSALSNEITREYQKEFIGEGQMFFYYKRLNMNLATATGTTVNVPPGAYVLPLPDAELVYNP